VTHAARALGLGAALALAACAGRGDPEAAGPAPAAAPAAAPVRDYLVLVASEAVDQVALLRFGPAGGRVERRATVGVHPTDPDGPHGLAVAPDGRHYFVSTAHGQPYGSLWKYTTANDEPEGRVELGAFPASLQVSPDGRFAWVVNFDLYGEMAPSSVSVVATDGMVEVARVQTCTMPHGSRLDPTGVRHWSVCMMDDVLVEIDARRFQVARHFMLGPGAEHGMPGAPHVRAGATDPAGHGMEAPPAGAGRCSPTWAAPSPDGARVYVACNAADDVVEIDVVGWRMVRRIPAGAGVYNVAVTRDGRTLIATNKRGRSVSLIDLATGRAVATLPTLRPVVHGIALSDDGRYAFVSVEGIGAEPGTVEMIDLAARRRVASVDVGQMAGGIDFWKSEPAR
jgi:DNA-binding beta-propeller fold protein YncE